MDKRRYKELTGVRFGKLTALSRIGTIGSHASWLCRCDCGIEKEIRADVLESGQESCGCIGREVTSKRRSEVYVTSPSEYGRNARYAVYRCSARKRGLSFSISIDHFHCLTQLRCYYCGADPSNVHSPVKRPNSNKKSVDRSLFVYNGLDRVDNERGYDIDNVVPCCKPCNWAKSRMTHQEFLKWIDRVYHHIHMTDKT